MRMLLATADGAAPNVATVVPNVASLVANDGFVTIVPLTFVTGAHVTPAGSDAESTTFASWRSSTNWVATPSPENVSYRLFQGQKLNQPGSDSISVKMLRSEERRVGKECRSLGS